MWRALFLIGLSACGFKHGFLDTQADGGDDVDAIDAPPVTADVKFISVTATLGSVRPGAYNWQVTAVLRNDLPNDISKIAPTLTFTIGGADRARAFRWRDIDMREGIAALPDTTLAAGSEVTYKFVVDALPWLVGPGPLDINGAATFDSGGTPMSAAPSVTHPSLPFAQMNAPLVVNTLTDENTANTTTSLREAMTQALAVGGLDHIMFDPAVFVAGSVLSLDYNLGELPTLDGSNGDIVIEGHAANVTITVDQMWAGSSRWPFRVTGGQVAIADIAFRDLGRNYPQEDLTSSNCGSNNQQEGGAIRIDGGTLIVESNRFVDPNVVERNCYAALLRYEGGVNHRIINNVFTNLSGDAMLIHANVREVTGNLISAGSDLTKVDDGAFISGQGNQDLWFTGNLVVEMEWSGLGAGGSDAGKLYVINNTFVRNGRTNNAAVLRSATRQITFKNNFYMGNNPAAVGVNNTGTGMDFDHEVLTSNALCSAACTSATQTAILTVAPPGVANSAGATFADFMPQAGSALLDSGTAYIDRNGSQPGHFNGSSVEVGAVEAP